MSLLEKYQEQVNDLEDIDPEEAVDEAMNQADEVKQEKLEECLEATPLTDIDLEEESEFINQLENIFSFGFEAGLQKGFELGVESKYVTEIQETLKKQQQVIESLENRLEQAEKGSTGKSSTDKPDYIS